MKMLRYPAEVAGKSAVSMAGKIGLYLSGRSADPEGSARLDSWLGSKDWSDAVVIHDARDLTSDRMPEFVPGFSERSRSEYGSMLEWKRAAALSSHALMIEFPSKSGSVDGLADLVLAARRPSDDVFICCPSDHGLVRQVEEVCFFLNLRIHRTMAAMLEEADRRLFLSIAAKRAGDAAAGLI